MPNATAPIEIFRAGRHTDVSGREVSVTRADLKAIADAYDPASGEAPLVVGHPKIDAPAYGWARKLEVRGDVLFATPDQVDPAFAQLVRDGRFKKRSASFFMPGSPGNPKPGGMYLRHIGFLGAAAPAVPGLRDVQFASDADAAVFEFAAAPMQQFGYAFRSIADMFRRVREWVIARDGVEEADKQLPGWQIDAVAEAARMPNDDTVPSFAAFNPSEEVDVSDATADFAARESALSEREAQIAARESAIRDAERASRRVGVVEFCSGLVREGRLLPRDQPAIVELLVTLGEAPHALSFAAADGSDTQQPSNEALRGFLSRMPVQVDFAERSAAEGDGAESADFASPPGESVDAAALDQHRRALAYQAQHPGTSYLAAAIAVG